MPTASAKRSAAATRSLAQQLRPLARVHCAIKTRGYACIDLAKARERIQRGRSAFNAAAVLRAADDLADPFDKTAAALERSGVESTTRIKALRQKSIDVNAAVVAWANADSVPTDATMRAARHVAAIVGNAVLSRVANDVTASVDLEKWRWAECPCCAASPDLALVTIAQRTLVCWRCDTRWAARHFGCLACGATNAPTLARVPSPYLGYELAICNSCGRYLKERRGAPSHDLLIERAIVASLDDAAQQRGLRA